MKEQPCRCEAWGFPHRPGSGDCRGHSLADCPSQIVEVDPYGTGDSWFRWVSHGCRGGRWTVTREAQR